MRTAALLHALVDMRWLRWHILLVMLPPPTKEGAHCPKLVDRVVRVRTCRCMRERPESTKLVESAVAGQHSRTAALKGLEGDGDAVLAVLP
jgi:hypothetical protein